MARRGRAGRSDGRVSAARVSVVLWALAAALAAQSLLTGVLPPPLEDRSNGSLGDRISGWVWDGRPSPARVKGSMFAQVKQHAGKRRRAYLIALSMRRMSSGKVARPKLIYHLDTADIIHPAQYWAELDLRDYKNLMTNKQLRELQTKARLDRVAKDVLVADPGKPNDNWIVHETTKNYLILVPLDLDPSGLRP